MGIWVTTIRFMVYNVLEGRLLAQCKEFSERDLPFGLPVEFSPDREDFLLVEIDAIYLGETEPDAFHADEAISVVVR